MIHSTDIIPGFLAHHRLLSTCNLARLREIFTSNRLGCGCLRGGQDYRPTYRYIPSPFRVPPYNKLKHCFPMPVQPITPHTRIPAYESSPNVPQRPCSVVVAQRSRAVWEFSFIPIPRSDCATSRRSASLRAVSPQASLAHRSVFTIFLRRLYRRYKELHTQCNTIFS